MNDSRHPHELHDIADLDPEGLPTARSLWKATFIAVAIAALILVTAVLPAEFGIDPLGIGKQLGLTSLHSSSTSAATASSGPLEKASIPYQTNTIELPLAPHAGAEIKLVMETGQSFVFEWTSEGGPVYVDMHADPADGPKGAFTSFWIEASESLARGTYVAPFKGAHGWYWENKSDQPVTIRLKTSGFYDSLYMP